MKNSPPLVDDSILLKDNKRCASAFAFSVIVLEEVGKLAFEMWKSSGFPAKVTFPLGVFGSGPEDFKLPGVGMAVLRPAWALRWENPERLHLGREICD